MDFFKNPIILGLLASSLTYLYLKWEEYKNKDNKNDDDEGKINIFYPILLGTIVFLGMTIWEQHGSKTIIEKPQKKIIGNIKSMLNSSSQLSSNIKRFGKSLPHVFIETS